MRITYRIICLLTAWVLAFPAAHAQKPDFESRLIDAVQKYIDSDFKGTVALLKDVGQTAPGNDAAWYYLGNAYFMLGDNVQAEKCLTEATRLDSTNYWYRYYLAQFYRMTGQKERTLSLYEKMMQDFPKKVELSYQVVNLYLADGQTDKALRTLEDIETVMGKNDATVMTRFNILRQQNKMEEAYTLLKEYSEEFASPQTLTLLGDYEMGMFNDTTALAYYDEALALDRDYPPARLGKAEAFRLTRRYPEYFSIVQDIASDPDIDPAAKIDYLGAVFKHSDGRFFQNHVAELDTTMEMLLRCHPADTAVLQTAGGYYFSTQRKERAKSIFRENRDQNPEDKTAALTYLQVLGSMGEWDNLVREAKESYARFPGETDFLEIAATAQYNQKNYQDVLEITEQILEDAAGDKEKTLSALASMGDIYHMTGDAKKAYKMYDRALKIDPNYVPVLNNYAYYLSEEGKDLRKAYKMSKKTIEAEPDNATYLDTFGWILYLQGKALEAKPFFKHAMLYGGKESATILDHYATVLESLGENDLAKVYRSQAKAKAAEEKE